MIRVEGLTKDYRGLRAVDHISFTCEPGTVTGFLGPNGAGKSTTLRILTGLTLPTAGTATIGGVSFHDIPNPGTQVGVLLDASAQHAGRCRAQLCSAVGPRSGRRAGPLGWEADLSPPSESGTARPI